MAASREQEMGAGRPFRFATGVGPLTSPAEWIARFRRLEDLGYSTVVLGQHLARGAVGQFAALATAAAATTSLRVATHVVPNDFYRPAVLAAEAATLSVLSGGRFELGLGAGWLRLDYDVAGLPYEPAGVRVGRFDEAVRLVKALLRGEAWPGGAHYPAMGPIGLPRAATPAPTIFVGGGSRRVLDLAGREADVVGLDLRSTPDGAMDLASATAERVAEKAGWVREAAGRRFDALELHTLVHSLFVVDDPMRGARMAADQIASYPATVLRNPGLSPEQLLASPHVLVGSVERIVETLHERRERFGISYVTVPLGRAEEFAPVVARLAGG